MAWKVAMTDIEPKDRPSVSARPRRTEFIIIGLVALLLGVEQMKTVDPATGADFLGTAAWYEQEAAGIEFAFPALFAQLGCAVTDAEPDLAGADERDQLELDEAREAKLVGPAGARGSDHARVEGKEKDGTKR